ncbi:TetR/AcrR family transcriptional regulator [Laceyella putida]
MMNQSTREKIEKIALRLFAMNGYEATTMNQIAEQVGITKPAIYVYFKGKEELYLAILEKCIIQYRQFMDQIINEAKKLEFQDQLFYIFRQYILFFAKNTEISAFWNRVMLFPPVPLKERIFQDLSQMELGYSSKLRAIFEQGIRAGKIRNTPLEEIDFSFRCVRAGLLMAFLLNPGFEEQKIERVWKDYWFGISVDS